MRRRNLYRLCVLAGLMLLTGCVKETVNGDERVYTYESWVTALWFVGGLVAAAVGWQLRQSSSRYGWGLVIVAPFLIFGVAPSMYLEQMVVNKDGFSKRSGIWGATASNEVKFSNVRRIRLTSRERRTRRGTETDYYLVFEDVSGQSQEVSMTNAVDTEAEPFILEMAKARGIQVVDETPPAG